MKSKKLGILPCQGACNVGCMMGKTNDKFIALNGCPMKCASKSLDKSEIKNYEEITLTSDFGIQKNKDYNDETNMGKVQQLVENNYINCKKI